MREIKVRYVQKSKYGLGIRKTYHTVAELEESEPLSLNHECWELLGRDLFIGILDKNGNEIYENDIIEIDYDGYKESKIVKLSWFESDAFDVYGYPYFGGFTYNYADNKEDMNIVKPKKYCEKHLRNIEVINDIYENSIC